MASQRIGRPFSIIYARLGLLLAGLVLLSAWSSPPSAAVPSMTVRTAMSPSWVMAGEGEAFPVLSFPEVRPAVVGTSQGFPPDDSLEMDNCNLDDDDPLWLAGLATANLVQLPPPLCNGIVSATQAFPQLPRYLVRPQLLTRL